MNRRAQAVAGLLGVTLVAIAVTIVVLGNQPSDDPLALASPTPAPSAEPSPTPGAPPSPSPFPTQSDWPSVTAGPTATPAPSATAAPTATATATPTQPPTGPPTATPSPTAAAHGWLRTPILRDDDWRLNEELRAALAHGGGMVLGVPSLALDGDGHAHVSWSTVGGDGHGGDIGGILYATNAGGSWQLSELTRPSQGSYDTADALAVDNDGSAVVAFMRIPDDERHAVYLITNRSGRWSELIEVPYPYDPQWKDTLAVRDGVIHLAYATWTPDGGPWQVWHAAYAAGTWTESLVAEFSQGYGPRAMALTLTSAGEPRFAFVREQSLYVATGSGGSFTLDEPIELPSSSGGPPLLAFDRDGGVHLLSGRQYQRVADGSLSEPRPVFPQVTWFDDCGERLRRGASPEVLGLAPDGTAHVLSFFDGPLMDSPWYSNNRGGGFEALKLYRPHETYAPSARVRETVDFCRDDVAIDFFDPLGVDMAIDGRGRPHIVTTNLEYFVGPAN